MGYDEQYRPSRARRDIVKFSPFHHVVQTTILDCEGRVQAVNCGSLLEYHTLLCCIYIEDCTDIEEQLAPVWHENLNGKPVPHWLDFRATRRGGRRIGISCKPARIAETYAYRETMRRVTTAAVPHVVDEVCIVTERNIDRVALHNAKNFHAARHPDPELDPQIDCAIKRMISPIKLRDFLHESDIGARGYRGVVRAIRRGDVCVAPGTLISADSLIWRKKA